jgi:hypothetical protein
MPNALYEWRGTGVQLPCPFDCFCLCGKNGTSSFRVGLPYGIITLGTLFYEQPLISHSSEFLSSLLLWFACLPNVSWRGTGDDRSKKCTQRMLNFVKKLRDLFPELIVSLVRINWRVVRPPILVGIGVDISLFNIVVFANL